MARGLTKRQLIAIINDKSLKIRLQATDHAQNKKILHGIAKQVRARENQLQDLLTAKK